MKSFIIKLFSGVVVVLGIQQALCQNSKFRVDFSNQNLILPGADVETSATNANLKGTGVSNAIFVLPPCFAAKPHYHPGASESNIAIQGKFVFNILDSNQTVTTGTLKKQEIVNYPQGFPHFQFNPFKETAVILATLNSETPGVFTLDAFENFSDEAVEAGLGQSQGSYLNFKKSSDHNLISRAKGEEYNKCLMKAGLPLPTPQAPPTVFSPPPTVFSPPPTVFSSPPTAFSPPPMP